MPPQRPEDQCFSLRSSHAQPTGGGSRIHYPSLSALMRETQLWQRSPVTHSSSSILQTRKSYMFYSKTASNVEKINLQRTAGSKNCIKNSSSESVPVQLRTPQWVGSVSGDCRLVESRHAGSSGLSTSEQLHLNDWIIHRPR